MTAVDAFKDYLAVGSPGTSEGEIVKALKELQRLLGDPQASQQRLMYLETLGDLAGEDPHLRPSPVGDPLTPEQYVACVRKGLVRAHLDGDVTAVQLLRLAHSVDGLRAFADALLETPEESHAACWKGALEVPFEIPSVDFERVVQRAPTEAAEEESPTPQERENWCRRLMPRASVARVAAYAAAAVLLIAFVVFLHPVFFRGPADAGSLVAEFYLEDEYREEDDGDLSAGLFGLLSPYVAYASPVELGFEANTYPYTDYTGDFNVPAGLTVRLVDDAGKEVASARTGEGGTARFDSVPSDSYTLVLEGASADYYVPVEISSGAISRTRVADSRPGYKPGMAGAASSIDSKTIHDSDGDGIPDDNFSYRTILRPVNQAQGGTVFLHHISTTLVDVTGNGTFDDPEDKRVTEPDDDGVPSDDGDGDEDNDGLKDNNPLEDDIDGDGLKDEVDPDIDGDGIPNGKDPYPDGITPNDDFDPPTMVDGTAYTGIAGLKVLDPTTVQVFFPVAFEDKSGKPSYVTYFSTTTPIDFENAETWRFRPTGRTPTDGLFSDTITAEFGSQTWYFAVRANDWAEPHNYDTNTKEISISGQTWSSDLDPIARASVDSQTVTVGKAVHFYSDHSHDPDGGEIVRFEWDWDNDGVYDEQGADVHHTWHTEGEYYVQFRIVDDEGVICELDEPLPVYVRSAGWKESEPTGPVWTWGGEAEDAMPDLAVDDEGSVYVAARFLGKIDLHPGEAHEERCSEGNWDIFLSKFSCEGEFLWTRTWGGYGYDEPNRIAVDADGNIYVPGRFSRAVDFDPGPGEEVRTAHLREGIYLTHDAFISKFDKDGEFQRVLTWGGPGYDLCHCVAIDDAANIYATGCFGDTVDFDPGPGTEFRASNGLHDAYLSKFDASGAFEWTQTWGSQDGTDVGVFAAADDYNNVYVTGGFQETADFDPRDAVTVLSSSGGQDAFLSKFDASGDFKWARAWGGHGADIGSSLAVSGSGGAYVAGWFNETMAFMPDLGVGEYTSLGGSDAYLALFDSDGGLIKVCTWGGTGNDGSNQVIPHASGRVLVAGDFEDTIDLDPGAGVRHRSSSGATDVYLGLFDSDCRLLSATSWGGPDADSARGISASDLLDIYVVGTFHGSADFDPGPGIDMRSSAGDQDIFLIKLPPSLIPED